MKGVKAAQTMDKVDLWRARMAMKTLSKERRAAICAPGSGCWPRIDTPLEAGPRGHGDHFGKGKLLTIYIYVYYRDH